jgi:hypothetical protein
MPLADILYPKSTDNLVRIFYKICVNQGGPEVPVVSEGAVSIARKILINQITGIGSGGGTGNTYFPSGWN